MFQQVDLTIDAARREDLSELVQPRAMPAWRFVRVHAPYALLTFPPKDDPLLLIPVNRQRAPLGIDCDEPLSLRPFGRRALRFHRDPAVMRDLWRPYYPYLYENSPAEPGYAERLHRLANLCCDPVTARAIFGVEELEFSL